MLTVYKASAGAGKTYHLTGEYLMLLFTHPTAYRRILAVTFTNKATDEMKIRIIEALYGVAKGTSDDHVEELCKRYRLSEKAVREKAQQILTDILHDYSAFNINTIDRFFQHTMRAFTREIGLHGGYGIEMDEELVLTEAVDRMLSDLDKAENKALLGWLVRFAEDRIENGGEWNFRREIMLLSKEVFKERYKTESEKISHEISDKTTLEDYKKTLQAIIRSTENEAKRLGEKGVLLISNYELHPSDFKGSSRSQAFYFERLAKGEMKPPTVTFIAMGESPENCYTKTTPQHIRDKIHSVFDEGLGKCFTEIFALFDNLTTYTTAKEILRYYYTLGILTDVSRRITTYREEKNVMLIADTTELLHKIIDGSDAPFIYEKTGTAVDHYMIDEFQDTSRMQWDNFRPLITESLSNNNDNLIVGDIKQSIYRFRNSDWKLLDEQIAKDFRSEQLKAVTLTENWRSAKHVVRFNNALFTAAPALLQNMYNETLELSSLHETVQQEYGRKLLNAYQQSVQQTAPPFEDKEGHVRITFLPHETEEEKKGWKERALEQLPGVLEQLQDNGYMLRDIAILTRTKREGAQVAELLLNYKEEHPSAPYKYDVISDEALYIGSSSAVRLIIAVMRHLNKPEDENLAAMARLTFKACCNTLNEAAIELQENKQHFADLAKRPLYEMTEELYRTFLPYIGENEQAFIQAFFDMVSEFSKKEGTDLSRFLKWWEEKGHQQTIETPDAQDAIRILTIHKSKGLGFKVVIIPFGDWEIDHKATKTVILWCQPNVSPFNKLSLVPVRYGQSLAQTIFAKDYFEERLHAYIDNLNTLYVAFTRAKEELIVFAPQPKNTNEKSGEIAKIGSIGDLLWAGLSLQMDELPDEHACAELPNNFDWETGLFELGQWWKPEKGKNGIKKTEEIEVKQFPSIPPSNRLHLRLRGKDLLFDDQKRKHGALMHEVLGRIRTKDEIDLVIENFRQEGAIDKKEAHELSTKLMKHIQVPPANEWFNGDGHVLNEIEILYRKGMSRRPDRVIIQDGIVTVIDYKFGEKEEKRYHKQVENYIKLIRQMGYSEVKGYLWYVELDKIEEVFL